MEYKIVKLSETLPSMPRKLIGLLCTLVILFLLIQIYFVSDEPTSARFFARENKFLVNDKNYSYNRQMPLIFIGGMPRSGTTLMRAMLDAHPDVRCGQETRVIPRLLQLRSRWLKSDAEVKRLQEAGVDSDVLNPAIAAFVLEIIIRHGELAPRLCNKDPLLMKSASYVSELFPKAKFIFMVRDGRATVHSIISRKVTITGFDLTSYKQAMVNWNTAVEIMYKECNEIGKSKCLQVPYEQLVLHPRKWMVKVLEFLEIPWNESVLHHEDFINNGIKLSKLERSSDQIINPVNLQALTKWVGHFPQDVVLDMANIAPMLSVLGYNPYENPPNYGKPDDEVVKKTMYVRDNKDIWEEKVKEFSLQVFPLDETTN